MLADLAPLLCQLDRDRLHRWGWGCRWGWEQGSHGRLHDLECQAFPLLGAFQGCHRGQGCLLWATGRPLATDHLQAMAVHPLAMDPHQAMADPREGLQWGGHQCTSSNKSEGASQSRRSAVLQGIAVAVGARGGAADCGMQWLVSQYGRVGSATGDFATNLSRDLHRSSAA